MFSLLLFSHCPSAFVLETYKYPHCCVRSVVGVRGYAVSALLIAFFIFGLVAGLFINETQSARSEYVLGDETATEVLPYDRIQESQVHVSGSAVLIDLPGAHWASFSPTGSMLPVLGSTAHALQIVPKSADDIHVGDVVSFHNEGKIISHRVTSIGADDDGTYFITQGDNNPAADPLKVRFSQIDRVLVGVLY